MIKARNFNNWPINLAPSREFDRRLRRPLAERFFWGARCSFPTAGESLLVGSSVEWSSFDSVYRLKSAE